jgi:hypothetical protein
LARRIDVGRLDLRAQPAGHARGEARIDVRDLLGQALRREQHPRAALGEVLERVQQLELRLPLAAQELDVLEDQQIAFAAIAPLELRGAVGADRAEQLVGELLARRVHHARPAAHVRLVGGGNGEVALPVPGARDDVERAHRELAAARDGEAGLARERIARPDDEAREGLLRQLGARRGGGLARIARGQRARAVLGSARAVRRNAACGRLAPPFAVGRDRERCGVVRGGFTDDEHHAHRRSVLDLDELFDPVQEQRPDALAMERSRTRETQVPVALLSAQRVDPRRQGERRELARKTADHAVPDLRRAGHATIPESLGRPSLRVALRERPNRQSFGWVSPVFRRMLST